MFEGSYAGIEISNCGSVRLKNVQTPWLRIRDTSVWVEGGRIDTAGVAVMAIRSRLTMTATDVAGEIGVVAEGSDLDLAGVSISGRAAALRATGSTRIVFSVSQLKSPHFRGALHETRNLDRGAEL